VLVGELTTEGEGSSIAYDSRGGKGEFIRVNSSLLLSIISISQTMVIRNQGVRFQQARM